MSIQEGEPVLRGLPEIFEQFSDGAAKDIVRIIFRLHGGEEERCIELPRGVTFAQLKAQCRKDNVSLRSVSRVSADDPLSRHHRFHFHLLAELSTGRQMQARRAAWILLSER